MAELYGAPVGILAAEANSRANILSNLNAQKTFGEIAMQPAKLEQEIAQTEMFRAHAGLYRSQSATMETARTAEAEMLQLQQRFLQKERDKEELARGELIAATEAQGRTATINDLPFGGSAQGKKPTSLERFAAFAEANGAPPLVLASVFKDISKVAEQTAVGDYRAAQARKTDEDAQQARFKQLGGIALAAADNPRSYASIMMDSAARKLLPKELSGNYQTDAPVLRAIAQSSMTANEQIDNKRLQAEADSKALRRTAGIAASNANVAASKVNVDLATERLAQLKKNGGDLSEATIEAKRAVTDAREAKTRADAAKASPAMPLNPKDVQVGKSYTGAGGVVYDIVGKDASGNPIGRARVVPVKRPKPVAAVAEGDDDE